jgi:hypothetical protein
MRKKDQKERKITMYEKEVKRGKEKRERSAEKKKIYVQCTKCIQNQIEKVNKTRTVTV